MFAKTMIALSAAIALAAVSGGLAEAKKAKQRSAGFAAFAQSAPIKGTVSSPAVIADGKVIGRDPDPNVRLNLLKAYPGHMW